MKRPIAVFAIFCLLGAASPIHAKSKAKDCLLNLKKDLHSGHPLILQLDAPEFLYPNEAKLKIPANTTALRVACPAGFITVKAAQTDRSVAGVECSPKGKFRFAGAAEEDKIAALFTIKDLKCSLGAQSSSHLLPSSNSSRLSYAEIGLQLTISNGNVTETQFVPTIQEMASGEVLDGRPIRWSRARVAPTILEREVMKQVPAYRKGVFSSEIDMDRAYIRANQRTRFLEIFNDTALVDRYLSDAENKYLVQGQLTSANDLFYEAQQESAYVYDNVLPVWQVINGPGGNWRLVDDLLKSHAIISKEGINVWSGGYMRLHLEDGQGVKQLVELTNGLAVPRFLFKYVHDPAKNRGLVFVTINNPHLDRAKIDDIICEKYSACDVLHPEFLVPSRGLTYCCRLESFRDQAELFGLPNFPDAQPLV